MPNRIQLTPEAASRIRQRMKELEYTQDDFSETLDISSRTLRNWLDGKHRISRDLLDKICMYLGLGVEDIFGKENLPSEYKPLGKLAQIVTNIRELIASGNIQSVIDEYKPLIEAMAKHVSFHKVPPVGPFVTINHDASDEKRSRYAHMVIHTPEYREEARYILSFQFFKIVRVNIGEIIVTKDAVTANPFFQKGKHVAIRDPDEPQAIHIATWFDEHGCYFFIEATDKIDFRASVTEMFSEREMSQKENAIAVFWKGVWH